MTWHDKIFVAFAMFAFMVGQAFYQHERTRGQGRYLSHNLHVWIYIGVSVLVCVPFLVYCGWLVALKLCGICAAIRIALYDPVLNAARKRKPLLTYNGRGTTGSVLDKLENMLPEKWLLPLKIGYIIIFVLYFILIR